jgi:hypothetical protein
MDARRELYAKCPSFFAYIMATMSAQSKAVVQAHPDYQKARVGSNVFVLFMIIRVTHDQFGGGADAAGAKDSEYGAWWG